MKYRALDLNADYPRLVEIWESSKMPVAPPKALLSQEGFTVWTDDEVLVGVIFTYLIYGSDLCLIGWPLLHSLITEDRDNIINELYSQAEDWCRKCGFTVASTWSELPHVADRLERNGWVAGDSGQTNYLKKL